MESAYLRWWEGHRLRTEPGVLWNISAGGAAIEVRCDLPPGQTAWLSVADLAPVRWFPARLLGREAHVVRLQFAAPLPGPLLETVVWGLPAENVLPTASRG